MFRDLAQKRITPGATNISLPAAGGGSGPGSARHNISSACFSCRDRKAKCSGGQPCAACSRSKIECVYNETLDKRRKLHWERSMTEASLQKEMLCRLLELIQSGGDAIQRRFNGDAHIQRLASSLGIKQPLVGSAESDLDAPQSQLMIHSREAKSTERWDDVSQSGELTKRRAIGIRRGSADTSVTSPLTISYTHTPPGTQQSILPVSSKDFPQNPLRFDARNQYRIFCSTEHTISSIESINIYGEWTSSPADLQGQDGPLVSHQQTLEIRIPEYLIQPLLFEEERCPLAAVYTDFRDYGRRQLAEGTPTEIVLGSPKVELTLFFRDRKHGDPHTPATWACEYMRLLKDLDIFVVLAFIFTYARFMRWTIAPSVQTYALLPEAMRPTPLQRLLRHHPGADLPIFPQMRDGLIEDMRDYIVAMQTFGCSVNWPQGLYAAIAVDRETETMTVSDAFAEHICNLANWSISESFADIFPEMRGYYDVVDQPIIPASDGGIEGFLKEQAKQDP